MIARLSLEAPLASATSWPGSRPPSLAMERARAALEAQAVKSVDWLTLQHRDGIISPAEKIVLDCLRALQKIQGAERMYADAMTDGIAKTFLDTALGVRNHKRRAYALLWIAGRST